jgi:alanine racemase
LAKIVLNKNNYFHNLKIIIEHAGSKDKVAVVLKDNAYGHGIIEIASLAKEYGIKQAVVRTSDEAKKVESYFEQILILADTIQDTYSHTFHIVINSLEDIERLPINTNVQLKVDTGMHRNGIDKKTLKEAIYRINKRKLNLTGVLTHYRSADELTCEFFWQRLVFSEIKNEVMHICEKLFISIPKFHSANSSGLFRFKNFDEDLVRAGIASYGYIGKSIIFKHIELKPIMSLWAKKIMTREIKKNQKVGYGGAFIAKKNMRISTYDIGYGDGFLRLNEKEEYLTPKGYKILGRVSMDSMSIESKDDEICIFDDVTKLAEIQNTIPYEIITTLNQNIEKEIH